MSLADLRALEQAASPAPWFVVGPPWNEGGPWVNAGSEDPHGGQFVCDLLDMRDEPPNEPILSEDNAALVVAARNALPGLLDRVAAAEAERDAYRAALERYHAVAHEWDDMAQEVREVGCEDWCHVCAVLAAPVPAAPTPTKETP